MVSGLNPDCIHCNRKINRKQGNCSRYFNDGHVIRCGPPWTIFKHNFIKGYCEIVTKAMAKKYHLTYIDIFCGPGKYFDRANGVQLNGSPLIAMEYAFNNYIFVDCNKQNVKALQYCLQNESRNTDILLNDCNRAANDINVKLRPYSLSFCLADPDNLRQLRYDTLKTIAQGKKVDLLINFPYWMDYKRNAKDYVNGKKDSTPADLFFGTKEWKNILKRNGLKFTDKFFKELIELYLYQFYKIGYARPRKIDNFQIIKNTIGKPIYLLLFLSKNELGYKFWKEIVQYAKGRNLELDLNYNAPTH